MTSGGRLDWLAKPGPERYCEALSRRGLEPWQHMAVGVDSDPHGRVTEALARALREEAQSRGFEYVSDLARTAQTRTAARLAGDGAYTRHGRDRPRR
jgi:hypothetical protein